MIEVFQRIGKDMLQTHLEFMISVKVLKKWAYDRLVTCFAAGIWSSLKNFPNNSQQILCFDGFTLHKYKDFYSGLD
ncbi:hypothetical protein ACHQM5_026205 [Ranunculus cassubicifolius]